MKHKLRVTKAAVPLVREDDRCEASPHLQLLRHHEAGLALRLGQIRASPDVRQLGRKVENFLEALSQRRKQREEDEGI